MTNGTIRVPRRARAVERLPKEPLLDGILTETVIKVSTHLDQ